MFSSTGSVTKTDARSEAESAPTNIMDKKEDSRTSHSSNNNSNDTDNSIRAGRTTRTKVVNADRTDYGLG
jgi:hypothetical protein